MIRTVRSGKVIEKSQFYVGERKPRAPRRKGNSSAARRDKNMNQAARQLARTINCNWSAGDLLLTLTYDDESMDTMGGTVEGAERACGLFWRRLGRALKAVGGKLLGFWVTADKDPETGEKVRLHHHAVISESAVQLVWNEDGTFASCVVGGREMREIWGHGAVNVERLRQQDDYTPVAVYLIRQAAGGENAKKWHPSRGLKKPVVESERVAATARELRAPGGATVSEVGHYDGSTGNHYIRYVRKPKPPKVGGHKERALAIPDREGGAS